MVGGGIIIHSQLLTHINMKVVKGYYDLPRGMGYLESGICHLHSIVEVVYMGAIQRGSTTMMVRELKMSVTNRQLEASGVTAAHTLLTREATKIAERRCEESSKVGGPKF